LEAEHADHSLASDLTVEELQVDIGAAIEGDGLPLGGGIAEMSVVPDQMQPLYHAELHLVRAAATREEAAFEAVRLDEIGAVSTSRAWSHGIAYPHKRRRNCDS